MKKALFLVVLGLVFAAHAPAQCTFTPITVGTTYTTQDNGTGPQVYLGIAGGRTGRQQYLAGSTIGTSAGSYTFSYNAVSGYVDIFAGFGGCSTAWLVEYIQSAKLEDVTTGTTVWSTAGIASAQVPCGAVPSCPFSFNNNNYKAGPWTLVGGHTYRYHNYLQAWVFMDTRSALSQVYDQYITINVHAI